MGKLLWHTMMSLDGFIAGPHDDMSSVLGVLRHDPPPDPPVVKDVRGRYRDMGIEKAVTVAKAAAGDDNVVVLGANIARQCLEAGLLEEIIIHIAPVLVGDGVRLFERAGGEPVKLDPISSSDEGAMTVLRYAVGRASAT